jgi:hypothetical protein
MNQYEEVSRDNSAIRPMKTVMRLAIAAVALVSLPAFATLGGNSASVIADQTAFQASLKTSAQPGYTDYSLTLPNGIIVHEFVNSANQVFEVTWNGKGMRPDMKQLLGSYFSHFGTSEKERQPTRRQASHIGANFVAHSAVHNRIFSGTAHVPSLMPAALAAPISVPNESLPVRGAN